MFFGVVFLRNIGLDFPFPVDDFLIFIGNNPINFFDQPVVKGVAWWMSELEEPLVKMLTFKSSATALYLFWNMAKYLCKSAKKNTFWNNG